jgi:3-deoxy-manno-octulosonate cytidylyltransferase (CMP-KDO synthetase)
MNSKKKILIVIPLRRSSVRVPEKIYSDIAGTSLSMRTITRVLEFSKSKEDVIVCAAVDDIKTLAHLKEPFPKLEVVMTEPTLSSGTDRVNSAFDFLVTRRSLNLNSVSAVINLQGDMPFFSTEVLSAAHEYFSSNPSFEGVWTAGHSFAELSELQAPQCVKALRSASGRAIYFSRFAIPFSRTEPNLANAPLCHIGIYAYSPRALQKFCSAPSSTWEQAESLEQLRALYLDIPFVIDEVAAPSPPFSYRGIDTPEDLAWAQNFAKSV